ncbi:MAG: deoxynucleoside kinase [Ignavibacteriales bacterium]|nr:deoxynucleoside kinase [Ignavibacteriales bacterium]MCF8435637.1 deoxynucleoside kinase [Ignavibacteriales bacterium]
MSEIKYIAIEGVIGAGKTTLAKMLSKKLAANLIIEEFEDNPFLEKFYKDKRQYAFQTQMFFLITRYKQHEKLNQENLFTEFLVSDYIFEKDRIFAYMNLSGEELKLYETLFPMLNKEIRKPDVVVYLQSSVERLMQNIRIRSRKIEKDLSLSYLQDLSIAYNDYFFKYSTTPLLIVNTTEIDFVENSEDFEELYKQIFRDDRGFIEYFSPESRRFK